MRRRRTENGGRKTEDREQMLSEEEVRHIAKLANLSLTDEEVKKFQKQLSETLEYVEILNELNTESVEATSQVTGLINVSREDFVKPSISQEEALSGAKSKFNNCFKVKAVIEK